MSKEEKKASEVILEMQEQLSTLTKLVGNQDYILKLILQKMNSIKTNGVPSNSSTSSASSASNTSDSTDEKIVSVSESSNPKKAFAEGMDAVAMKVRHAQQENKTSKFEQMKHEAGVSDNDSSGADFQLEQATSFVGHRRGDRVGRSANQVKKISVSQQVLDNSGKPLSLATVKITDQFDEIVKSARSNTKGKWNAPLSPGEYNIHVLRKFASDPNKEPVELRYSVHIPNVEEGAIELPPPNLE